MREIDFHKVRVLELSNTSELLPYDYFLTPELASIQSTKQKGDTVTIYQVDRVLPNGNITYQPKYLILE